MTKDKIIATLATVIMKDYIVGIDSFPEYVFCISVFWFAVLCISVEVEDLWRGWKREIS